MYTIREEFLSLAEVNDLIRKLEEKHRTSTADFLLDAGLRERVPEDDVFLWEALLSHNRELTLIENELRTAYLEKVTRRPEDAVTSAPTEKQLLLAA